MRTTKAATTIDAPADAAERIGEAGAATAGANRAAASGPERRGAMADGGMIAAGGMPPPPGDGSRRAGGMTGPTGQRDEPTTAGAGRASSGGRMSRANSMDRRRNRPM